MELAFGELITLGLAALAGVVWLVRIEGALTKESALRSALESRIDGFEARIYRSLERIENKLDSKDLERRDRRHEDK